MKKRLALLLSLLMLAYSPAALASSFDTALDTKEMDFTFTDRELAGTCEVRKAVGIHGNGGTADISGTGAALTEGGISITREGVYLLTGTFEDLPITVEVDDNDKVQIVLDNAVLTNQNGPCLYVREADKVFLTLPEDSESTLTDGASYSLADDETTLDAAIFSRADLCINGSGTLTVNGQYKHGIVSKDDLIIAGATVNVTSASTALDGKDCLKVTGSTIALTAGSNGIRSDNAEDENRGFVYLRDSTLTIVTGNDGIQAETLLVCENCTMDITAGGGSATNLRSSTGSWKGLKSSGDMWLGGNTCTIFSQDDCIHSNSSITIADGTYTLSSGDDGVHADTNLTISGGTIDVLKSYEGLEASKLVIAGGTITIVASDDGLNAAGGADGSGMGNRFGRGMFSNGVGEIEISGGYTCINASGDGIDSNGSILLSGGVTLVSGPTNSGNAAFDYDGSARVTGGILIAAGPMGMAQNFTEAENQGAMLVTFGSQQSGTSLALTNADGLMLASFTPASAYQCAVITSPAIQAGQTYTLIAGCTVDGADAHGFAQNTTAAGGTVIDRITMTSLLYGGSGGFGMWNHPGGGFPGGGGGGGRGGWFMPGRDPVNTPPDMPEGDGGMYDPGTPPEAIPTDSNVPEGNGGWFMPGGPGNGQPGGGNRQPR